MIAFVKIRNAEAVLGVQSNILKKIVGSPNVYHFKKSGQEKAQFWMHVI